MMDRQEVRTQLESAVLATLGVRIRTLDRLRGGTKKGVYRLGLDGGGSVIAYRWADEEDFWPARPDARLADSAHPFSHATGLGLFGAAQRRLAALGIRVPDVLLLDGSRQHGPADLALLEDVPGGSLETLLDRDPLAAEPVLRQLADQLGLLHRQRGPAIGKAGPIDDGAAGAAGSCEQLVLSQALADLAEATARDPRIAAARHRLSEALHTRAAAVRPRDRLSLIHGELGPDHVLVGRTGEPVLIDIEGLMYFDAEWEHVFLRLRFHQHYRWLASPHLDQQRLDLYALAIRLSLVAGPLRLLDGGFPGDREAMRGIAEHNLHQALALVE